VSLSFPLIKMEEEKSELKNFNLLTKEQLEQYFNYGYLIVENFFEESDLKPVINDINKLVDQIANDLFDAGKIKQKYENEPFETRLIFIEKEFPGAAVLLHKVGQLPVGIEKLWSSKKLLDIIEQILGPEIAGHPVWNIRTKTPNNPLTTVPWHQDAAYLAPESIHTLQPTVWIPFVDANNINGCMSVLKYGHQSGKMCTHTCCAGPSWYISIDDAILKPTLGENCEIISCHVKKGGILLINQLIPHMSSENLSNIIRWSVDLRYQRPNEPSGFVGAKLPILLRTAKDPNYIPDFSKWGAIERLKLSETEHLKVTDKFSTIIAGPWMKRWEIIHHNKNTNALDSPEFGLHKS